MNMKKVFRVLLNINRVAKMKTIFHFCNNLHMTFSITSIISQTCLPLLKFEKKKSDSLETSSMYFMKNTQCRTLNNKFLAAVFNFKKSEITIHSNCNNLKNVNIKMPNIITQDIMMAFTTLKIASRPTKINETLFGVRSF